MSNSRKWKIKIAVIFISLCMGLQYSISPVLNQIQDAYPKVKISFVQMLITAPALLSMIIALVSGWLVLKVSKKQLALLGTFLMGICGFIPFLSDSFILLFLSRIFLGIGLGLVTVLSTAIVAEHFEGIERVKTLGIQGASVGIGMFLSTTLGGLLGTFGFQYSYWVHLLGIISAIVVFTLLPETGRAIIAKNEKLELNIKVYKVSLLMVFEVLFLITFSTNIAMHIGGSLAGNSSISGVLTGAFSGIQIVAGIILGFIRSRTKQNTLPLAMMSFGMGSLLLLLFPASFFMLLLGSLLCGFSQGVFVPSAMYEVSNAVSPVAVTLATACLNLSMGIAQLVSPSVLNGLSQIIFGEVTTVNVFTLCAIAMTVFPMALIIRNIKINKTKLNAPKSSDDAGPQNSKLESQ